MKRGGGGKGFAVFKDGASAVSRGVSDFFLFISQFFLLPRFPWAHKDNVHETYRNPDS